MEVIAADKRHPDRTDGNPQHSSPWDIPLVKEGEIFGTAVEYTRSYGLVEGHEPDRAYRVEWFPAADIKRVDRADWHGK